MGGKKANPSYEGGCSGQTGPPAAEQVIRNLGAAKIYDDPIITEVVPASKFYVAEDYHQEYFQRNPAQPYCAVVVRPKVAKVRKHFLEKLKKKPASDCLRFS